jgi:hypothetical protein
VTIEELKKIEKETAVTFSLTEAGTIAAKGPESAVDRALKRVVPLRAEVATLLRERQGIPEPGRVIVTREISPAVPSKAVNKANYVCWLSEKSGYYHPSADELERMFSAVEEGDEVLPDFAHSFTVRKPDGRLISIDRKGRIGSPSPYSPAMTAK